MNCFSTKGSKGKVKRRKLSGSQKPRAKARPVSIKVTSSGNSPAEVYGDKKGEAETASGGDKSQLNSHTDVQNVKSGEDITKETMVSKWEKTDEEEIEKCKLSFNDNPAECHMEEISQDRKVDLDMSVKDGEAEIDESFASPLVNKNKPNFEVFDGGSLEKEKLRNSVTEKDTVLNDDELKTVEIFVGVSEDRDKDEVEQILDEKQTEHVLPDSLPGNVAAQNAEVIQLKIDKPETDITEHKEGKCINGTSGMEARQKPVKFHFEIEEDTDSSPVVNVDIGDNEESEDTSSTEDMEKPVKFNFEIEEHTNTSPVVNVDMNQHKVDEGSTYNIEARQKPVKFIFKTEEDSSPVVNVDMSEHETGGTVDVSKCENGKDINNTCGILPKKKQVDFELEEDTGLDCFSEFVDRVSVLQVDELPVHGDDTDQETVLHFLKKKQQKHLKMVLRHASWGIRHDVRETLWFELCRHLHKADDSDIFSEFAKDLFSGGDGRDVRIPSFVDLDHLNSYHLNTEGVRYARQILAVLEHSSPDITYSPLLFSLLSLLLHYMDVPMCYNCLYSLLRHKGSEFLSTTKVSYEASKLVIRDLAKKYAKSGFVHLVRNCSNIDQIFDSWVWWIFEELPFPYLIRIMDCYLNEGVKVFYRVILAILQLYGKANSKKFSAPKKELVAGGSVLTAVRQYCREIPVSVDKLLKTGFSIRGLTRKEIHKLQVKHEMYINSTKNINNIQDGSTGGRLPMSRSFSGPIVLQSLGSNTLTTDMLYTILTWLPTRYAICTPVLLYTSEEHGTSLVTLYERVEYHQPTIIIIKTTDDEIFGAFCSACWRDRRQKSQLLSYFGTGETFLFTLAPEKRKYEWVGLTGEDIPNTASMFQAGDRTILTVGGGHGEAIFLDENLLHCRSERCDTFNNEPLSKTEDFSCKVVEVYGFQ